MRTFIYKRTPTGDPDRDGRFGVRDCMGRLRDSEFEAVIGVGGIGSQAKSQKINRKVNWIGIGPRKRKSPGKYGPVVTFSQFVLFETKGKKLKDIAPKLARRMYSEHGPRFTFNDDFTEAEQAEVDRLLKMAKSKRSSRVPKGHVHAGSSSCPSEDCQVAEVNNTDKRRLAGKAPREGCAVALDSMSELTLRPFFATLRMTTNSKG